MNVVNLLSDCVGLTCRTVGTGVATDSGDVTNIGLFVDTDAF